MDLSGPGAIARPIGVAYERFAAGADVQVPVAQEAPDTPAVNGAAVHVPPGTDPVALTYGAFTRAIQRLVAGPALLHGAALVGPGGRATVISAPAAHGKTSLGLELLARGFRFLTDDYAPLDLDRRVVGPFPRRVAIRGGGRAPLPAAFAAAASAPDVPRLLGKALVDVGHVLGEDALAAPAELGCVVLVSGRDPAQPPPAGGLFTVCVAAGAAPRFERAFRGIAGLRIVERRASRYEVHWTVETRGGAQALAALVEDDPEVLLVERAREEAPDFSLPPAARRIGRLEAATALAAEMFNRRADGRFMARFDGSAPAFVAALAGALAGAVCWRLRPGPLHETADLVVRLQETAP